MDIKLIPVIDFGKMPLANGFLTPEEFATEYFNEMVLGYNSKTKAVGLMKNAPPKKIFNDHFAFYSSTSRGVQTHFAETAKRLLPYTNGLVVELGSNDGIMLEPLKNLGVQAIGIDASKNVAKVSKAKGHDVIVKFMDSKVVDDILARGKVSLLFAADTFSEIPNLSQALQHVTKLIDKDGVFVFEDSYFPDIVRTNAYDMIFNEHSWYFTVTFINNILKPLGYHVFNCEHLSIRGGEMRMYVGHKDTFPVESSVAGWLEKEKKLDAKIKIFATNTKKSKNLILKILMKIKKDGKSICGFGAASKLTTLFNYCNIGPDLIPFVTDNTPIKVGKYYPGVHIPVVSQEVFEKGKTNPKKRIDYALLGAWNHFTEVNKYQSWYEKDGGKWITHVPKPHIINT